MAITDQDRQTVRQALRSTVVSGFAENWSADAPLTIADVACRVRSEYARGVLPIQPADALTSRQLLTDETPLVGRMTPRNIAAATAHLDLTLSDHYWKQFHREAITMLLTRDGQRRGVGFACPAGEQP